MVIRSEMQRDIAHLSETSFWRRNIQPIVLGLASLALFAAGWQLVRTITDLANRQFEAESNAVETHAQFELFRAVIWLKDSTNFINSGAGDLFVKKLRNNPNGSNYVHSLGYIEVASGKTVDLLRGTQRTTAFSSQISSQLLELIDDRRGNVFAFNGRSQADVLGKVPPKTLVLMQVQPLPQPDERISFVAFNVEGLCRDMVGHGQFAAITRLTVFGENYALPCATSHPAEGIASYFQTRAWSRKKYVSDNLYIDLETSLKIPFADEVALICAVAAGCLLVIVAAAVMTGRWRRRTRAVLLSALDEAASSSSAKGEFLANMSHEIRTPMNGVMGMTELLARTQLDSDQQRYVRQIRSSGSALLAILNDVLDLSKIDQGKLAIDPIKTDIRTLVQDILLLYTANAEENNSSLLLDISRDVPRFVLIDPTRLRQVIGNLVSNAVKFTKDGEVLLQLDVEDPSGPDAILLIRVLDSGIGISPEQQQRLFERFSQAEAGTSRQYGGTGLGLSIVQQLVELMDGSISVYSTIGQGSTFTVQLPLVHLDEASALPQATGSHGVALISPSSFVEMIVRRALGDECIDVRVFTSFPEALGALAQDGTGPFLGILIDEARDVHAAWEGWQALRAAGGLLEGGWSIMLADHQSHRLYRDFDKTITKPFNAVELIQQISALMQAQGKNPGLVDDNADERTQAPPLPPPLPGLVERDAGLFEGRRCLVVDDNTINQMVVTEMLQPFGFTIDVAADGRKALAAAHATAYDIIFMDCRMPHMDGYEATRELCRMMQAGEIAHVPIVALTANAMKGDREECLACGMTAFLSKPVQLPELTDVLLSLVTPATHTPDERSEPQPRPSPPASTSQSPLAQPPIDPGCAQDTRQKVVHPDVGKPASTPFVQTLSHEGNADRHRTSVPARNDDERPEIFQDTNPVPDPFPAPSFAPEPTPEPPRASQPEPQREPAPSPTPAMTATAKPAESEEDNAPCAILDLDVFRQLKATMRSHAKLVEIYKADGYGYLRQIEEAFALEDLQSAILPAHTLKSSSKIMGANAMVRIASSLETALRQPEPPATHAIKQDLDQLKSVFASTIAKIEAE
ncbi:MAG: ATP-binding protein [Pseudomonadota bacterium]|nr:ATP-binding protein [Pseudomonadota bacterium]